MGKLTKRQKKFDIAKYLPEDMPSTEAIDRQVVDPFTGEIHAPGLVVAEDGRVTFVRRQDD